MPARGYEFYLRVFNSKIQFVSTSGHVIFCLSYKHTNEDVFDEFPKISEHIPKISEDSSKVVRRLDECFRTFSENFPRLPKISEEEPMTFRSYSNTSKYFLRIYVTIAMGIFSIVKITCYFHA